MRSNKQFWVVLSILAVALFISVPAFLVVPSTRDELQVSRFPMTVGEWRGRDLPADERAYEILETRNLILREYTRGEDVVYLYIIYSQDNRKVSHPPEVCLEGSGITVVKKQLVPLELADGQNITVNQMAVEKAGAVNIMIYWYKAGAHYTDSYLKQQLRIALGRLYFKPTSAALIRISSEVTDNNIDRTLKNLQSFAKEGSKHFSTVIP